ncbi:tetratricopeptide repeat protein 24-like [Elysia marginata]|uniref:Tetratricopeptide repeat protein 24-like n=1 Tax=Elysia marginata TaxID=1093978 RepID=A0AAV4I2I2_9GAST|nr:tetratricopeptide repeat protein 24-like [Elysia marginata]
MEKGERAVALDVERYSKLGTENLQQGQLQQALEAFTIAYKSAQALGNHGYMLRACAFNVGALLISMGRFNDGLQYLKLAKPDEGCRDGRSNGDLYFNYGLAYEGLKNFPESRYYLEKALNEYCSEHSNVKMEADTTKRLGQLCVTSGLFSEAEAWMKKLIQAYEILGDKESRYQAEAERANLLLKMGKVEEAEEIADDCLKGAKMLMSPSTGNVFNELGLVFTQMTKYEKAVESSQLALSILKSSVSDEKLVAVLYQNMGALYNYMSRFEEAIEYHKTAIEKHAELKNRKSQGHCFINLGYAYSQLKELDKAGESFLHAVQAAKDCGDKKSEWQSFEALGSVSYSLGDLERSKEYYKQSLCSAGQTPDIADKDVQDRILTKLTHVIQAQTQKLTPANNLKKSSAHPMVQKLDMSTKQTSSKLTEEDPFNEKQADGDKPDDPIKDKNERVIAIRRGSKIKHIKVRRSGTLRQFKKFALGLDVTRPNTAELQVMPGRDNVSILSAETISEHEIDNEDDSDSEDHDRKVKKYSQDQDGIEADDDSDESGDDMRKVQAEMKKVASLNDADMPGTSGFVSKKVSADVHAKAQDIESDSEDSDSSELDSSDDSDDDEEQYKADSKLQKKNSAPPVPSLSPPTTKERVENTTYERPSHGELLYETIDHHKSRGNTQGEDTLAQRRASDDDGLNFFHADGMALKGRLGEGSNIFQRGSYPQDKNEYFDLKGTTSSSTEIDKRASDIFSGTVYETIRSQSRQGHLPDSSEIEDNIREPRMSGGDMSSNLEETFPSLSKKGRPVQEAAIQEEEDEEEEENSLQEMSRAQRDVLMFNEFKKDAANHEKSQLSEKDKEADQKNSKHCIIM